MHSLVVRAWEGFGPAQVSCVSPQSMWGLVCLAGLEQSRAQVWTGFLRTQEFRALSQH